MSDTAQATAPDTRLRVAEVLYDELTGRHDGEPDGPNAVLRPVTFNPGPGASDHDRQIHRLTLEATSLGLELHYPSGDRWGLAQRLADKVIDAVTSPAAEA